ncbi:MAG TPA: hypothetical protein VEA37_03810, partial [Flavobacterium sp.]|nr:hypothetical protein [Flavobacterium sp.]
GGKVYSVNRNATTTALSGNARVYEIDGELIVMWPNSMDGRKMWKLKEDVAVNISDNGTVTNPNSLRVGADQVTAVVEYTDKKTGQIKVLAAESLEIQSPCAIQPYGPPINIKDVENKVKLSQALSIDLWNWILQKNFVENSQGAGLSDY